MWLLSINIWQVFWGRFWKFWLERQGRSSLTPGMVYKRNVHIEWADFGANRLLGDVFFLDAFGQLDGLARKPLFTKNLPIILECPI